MIRHNKKVANESSTSSAKMLKRIAPEEDEEAEDHEGINDQHQNQKALNPLFFTDTLSLILNYLPVDDLKKSRLVCELWRVEGAKILLKKSNVNLECVSMETEEDSEDEEEIEEIEQCRSLVFIFGALLKSIWWLKVLLFGALFLNFFDNIQIFLAFAPLFVLFSFFAHYFLFSRRRFTPPRNFNNMTPKKTGTESGEFEAFVNTKGPFFGFNSAITDMKDPNQLKNTLPLLLQRTTCLLLKPYNNYSNSNTELAEFLDFFPNLQILHLEIYWAVLEDFPAGVKRSLSNKFESLKEIRLEFRELCFYHFTNLLLEMKNQLPVKEILLQNNGSTFFAKYLKSGCNWPIDTLVLEMHLNNSEIVNNVRAFLVKISGSLKHLKWTFRGSFHPLPKEYYDPWANNMMKPFTFNGLETLKIFCERWNAAATDYSWLLFTCALQLRSLKKLIVDHVPGNLEWRIRQWNDHPDAKGRSLRSESLEELKFIHNGEDVSVESMIIFSQRLWQNLKFLSIENPPNNLPTLFLLSEWIGLERLDLKFEKLSQENAALWTKWLTGEKDGGASSDDTNFTLKDLKDLKHFGLWENWYGHPTRIATEFMVENSLKLMTQLQSLHLENSKISWEVKKMLKKALGPNVNVEYL